MNGKEVMGYLPTLIFGKTMSNNPNSIQDYIFGSTGFSLTSKYRRFLQWTHTSKYRDAFGMVQSTFYPDISVDLLAIQNYLQRTLNLADNQTVEIQKAPLGFYDFYLIAEYIVYEQHHNKINQTWEAKEVPVVYQTIYYWYDAKDELHESLTKPSRTRGVWSKNIYRYDIKILFKDGTEAYFVNNTYDRNATYIYASYNIITEHETTDPNTGAITTTYSSDPHKFVYFKGNGIAELDNLMNAATSSEYAVDKYSYYPYIPFRHENNFYSENYQYELYKLAKEGMRIISGSNKTYDEIIDKVADNPSIGDIDHANIVFGVDLHTDSFEGLKYLYEYFYNLWLNKNLYQANTQEEWTEDWISAYKANRAPQTTRIYTTSGAVNFDVRLEYQSIGHYYGTGLFTDDAKAGDYGTGVNTIVNTYTVNTYTPDSEGGSGYYDTVTVTEIIFEVWFLHQISQSEFEYVCLANLTYGNYIYGDEAVIYDAAEVLINAICARNGESRSWFKSLRRPIFADRAIKRLGLESGGQFIYKNRPRYSKLGVREPDASGFIVPLEDHTLRELSLVDQYQLTQETTFIVFNCYVEQKVRWYQEILQPLIIIVAIVITAICWWCGPAAAGGSSLASTVGGSFASAAGLTAGTLAYTLVAVAVNALVGILIGIIFSTIGEAIGGTFGKIFSIVGSMVATFYVMGGNLASLTQQLSSPRFWLQISKSTLDFVTQLKAENYKNTIEGYSEQLEKTRTESEQLELISRELDTSSNLDIHFIQRTMYMRNGLMYSENRDNYIYRTVDSIHYFADDSLGSILNYPRTSLLLSGIT
jgi:hypothetical protein